MELGKLLQFTKPTIRTPSNIHRLHIHRFYVQLPIVFPDTSEFSRWTGPPAGKGNQKPSPGCPPWAAARAAADPTSGAPPGLASGLKAGSFPLSVFLELPCFVWGLTGKPQGNTTCGVKGKPKNTKHHLVVCQKTSRIGGLALGGGLPFNDKNQGLTSPNWGYLMKAFLRLVPTPGYRHSFLTLSRFSKN